MTRLFAVFIVCLCSWLAGESRSLAGKLIEDNAYGFTLTVPDGFEPNAEVASASPDVLHGFARFSPDETKLNTLFFVEKLPGPIGRQQLTLEHMPKDFPGSIYSTQWREFAVDAIVVPEQFGELQAITINVQVPIKTKAIQLKLFGPAEEEEELRAMMDDILASMQGASNWDVAAAPAAPQEGQSYFLLIVIGIVVLSCLFFVPLCWYAPPGLPLLLAAIIYFTSFVIDAGDNREFIGLIGVVRMFGFVGGVISLVHAVLRRRKKPEAAKPADGDVPAK